MNPSPDPILILDTNYLPAFAFRLRADFLSDEDEP
jgi:hypothetical protein